MSGATSVAGGSSGRGGRRLASPAEVTVPVRGPASFRQSVLVLGTAQLGGPYGITNVSGTPDDRAAARLLRLAGDLGVTHLDTARTYGRSESRIGELLRAPDAVPLRAVTTVAPLGAAAAASADDIRAAVRRSVTRSVAELDAAAPPTVLLHSGADAAAAGGAAWEQLRDYRAAGVIDRIGVSVRAPDDLPPVLDLPDLGYLRVPCNVLDTRWVAGGVAGMLAGRPDLVVTTRSVLLQGLLATGGSVRWPFVDDKRRAEVLATLDRLVGELGREGRVDLCLAYVLALPWVTSVVLGAENAVQLRANAELVTRAPLSPTECDRVRGALPPVPAALLDPERWPPSR